MVHVVGAALFVPAITKRYKANQQETTVQNSKVNAVNLVQIAVLPEWGGRNLGGIALDYPIKEQLCAHGFDLLNLWLQRKLLPPSEHRTQPKLVAQVTLQSKTQ